MSDKQKTDDVMHSGAPEALPRLMSRRGALKSLGVGAAAIVMAQALPGCGGARADGVPGSRFAYAGAYTPNGKGIYLFSADGGTGALTELKSFTNIASPSWLALDAAGGFLYAVNEVTDFNGGTGGSVSAFSVNSATGDLTLINVVDSKGGAPVYVAVHPAGKHVLVANYMGANVAVFPILPNGGLGNASDVKQITGPLGPTTPVDAPKGSFVASGHDASHAHMVQTDPSGRFVYVSDLGTDRIFIYQFNVATGALTAASPAFVSVSAGAGPRHFTFHPNGRNFYAVTEEASTLVAFDFDAASGQLIARQSISILPEGFAGTSYASEVIISADGKFIYAVNRLHDSVAIFSVNASGLLTRLGEAWTRGSYPRHISIDPSGSFLYACNQRSDAITTFRIDKASGDLSFTGQYTPAGSPAVLVFR